MFSDLKCMCTFTLHFWTLILKNMFMSSRGQDEAVQSRDEIRWGTAAGETTESKPKKHLGIFFVYFYRARVCTVLCVCHSFAYVAHFGFFKYRFGSTVCQSLFWIFFGKLEFVGAIPLLIFFAHLWHLRDVWIRTQRAWRSKVPEVVNFNRRRYDMNGRSQMQGGKNWILPKKTHANRFFWDSHWLEIWKNHLCPSMGPNC